MVRPLGNERVKCCECNLRLARYASRMCQRCHFRTLAEGTQTPRRNLKKQEWHKKARRYNRLVAKGMTQQEVAQLWGQSQGSLRGEVYKWRKGGIAVAPTGRDVARGSRKPVKLKPRSVNPHGGGKWGRTGCKCDPCVMRRRQTRQEYYRRTGN